MKTIPVTVLDYGMGNLRSAARALTQAGGQVTISQDLASLQHATRLVIPGQGAVPATMRELERRNLLPTIKELAAARPVLGLCVGLQLLFGACEEGPSRGIDLWEGEVKKLPTRLPNGERLKVPHMGWNNVRQVSAHPLWSGINDEERFYFVHSYYVAPATADIVCGRTNYGGDFASACEKENIFAVQFHPEKSGAPGLQLLKNFLHWTP